MLRRFVSNTAYSAAAYLLIGMVGFLLAPFLIGAYGLGGYGEILLVRSFLPNSTLGMLDLGIGETGTRVVAAARHSGRWAATSRAISLLLALALALGLILGGLLFLFAEVVSGLLGISDADSRGFVLVLQLTAVAIPLMFLSLVFEGILKGYERFRILRLCEVVGTGVFAALTVLALVLKMGPASVALALLIGLLVRLACVAFQCRVAFGSSELRLMPWDREAASEVFAWARLMILNKILSTLQNSGVLTILGLILGPVAVGAYDVATRLPRFAKSLIGLLNAAVLPAATLLNESRDHVGLSGFARFGILWAMLLAVPPLIFAATASEKILEIWISPDVASLWPWQSLAFITTALLVPISFGGSLMMAARPSASRHNLLLIAAVTLQYGLAYLLYEHTGFREWSFLIASFGSLAIVWPFHSAMIASRTGTPAFLVSYGLLFGLIAWILAELGRRVWQGDGPLHLLLTGLLVITLSWVICVPLALGRGGRRRFAEVVAERSRKLRRIQRP